MKKDDPPTAESHDHFAAWPTIDLDTTMLLHRRNLEAIHAVNQLVAGCVQVFARHQVDILAGMENRMLSAFQKLAAAQNGQHPVNLSTRLVNAAAARALLRVRELSELVAKTNADAIEVIEKRAAASLDEVQSLVDEALEKAMPEAGTRERGAAPSSLNRVET